MSVTVHQRPGVYSSYDASTVVGGRSTGRLVGLAAVDLLAELDAPRRFDSYEEAVEAFGTGGAESVAELVRVALRNGACGVVVALAEDRESYDAAFEALAAVEDIAVMICDSTDQQVQKQLCDSVEQASQNRRERLCVMACGKEETVAQIVARAQGIDHHRAVLVAPGCVDGRGQTTSALPLAAAVAGILAGESDPAIPLGGARVQGLSGLAQRYTDQELDQLILGGVAPVEEVGGSVAVVRGVTTATTSGGVSDSTWRDLSTIRVVDDVIPGLRAALRTKFRRAKNTPQSRGAIRAQVVLELENKLAREIITGYENVSVRADPADAARCLVEFSFTVAHGLNQIWLTAHITV